MFVFAVDGSFRKSQIARVKRVSLVLFVLFCRHNWNNVYYTTFSKQGAENMGKRKLEVLKNLEKVLFVLHTGRTAVLINSQQLWFPVQILSKINLLGWHKPPKPTMAGTPTMPMPTCLSLEWVQGDSKCCPG